MSLQGYTAEIIIKAEKTETILDEFSSGDVRVGSPDYRFALGVGSTLAFKWPCLLRKRNFYISCGRKD